jgi:hypothetical protein
VSDLTREILWGIAITGLIAAVAGIAQDLARLVRYTRRRKAERELLEREAGRWHPDGPGRAAEHDQAEADR